jgi:glyoxylase-like metal-dependent hydrolase (beta-lactamase superfamily II)
MRSLLILLCLAMLSRTSSSREAEEHCDANLFFHQILAGRDIADPKTAANATQRSLFQFARQMQNFQYIVGDPVTSKCALVDAAFDPEGIVAIAADKGYDHCAYIATHHHYDHIGRMAGNAQPELPGLQRFVSSQDAPTVWIHEAEREVAAAQVGVDIGSLTPITDGETISIGNVSMRVIHTPGHSPGSVVLVVSDATGRDRLALTGDTVFPGSCGRVDLPGSDIDAMFTSLQTKLKQLDDALPIYPGHAYSGHSSTIGKERQQGLLRPGLTIASWRKMMRR